MPDSQISYSYSRAHALAHPEEELFAFSLDLARNVHSMRKTAVGRKTSRGVVDSVHNSFVRYRRADGSATDDVKLTPASAAQLIAAAAPTPPVASATTRK
mgnify:CR=1 FL=1